MRRPRVSATLRFEVLKRDDFACQYCGAKAPDVVLHCDHVVPACLGGKNEMENLATACSDCNLGKGARRLNDRSAIQRQLELLPREAQERIPPRLFYIQGILRNRFGDRQFNCIEPLRDRLAGGVSLDALERAAKQARDWAGFERLARS